jgi:carbon storage regulator
MLVLSRSREETIMIGDDVEVTVLDIRGDKVRLGIRAPSKISVHRKEVYLAIREENARAAEADAASLNQAMVIFQKRSRQGALSAKERTEE